VITLTAFPHQTIIKSGTSDYIPIAILSRKFSPSFCIYIQTGLNLFPTAAKYVPGEKEKAAFPFSPVSRLVAMVVGGGNGRMPTAFLPLPPTLSRLFQTIRFVSSILFVPLGAWRLGYMPRMARVGGMSDARQVLLSIHYQQRLKL